MNVLGDLIDLSPEIARARHSRDAVRLPLPWYIRASLGLLSDTTVYVSILTAASSKDGAPPRLGDVVVSVVDPTRHLLKIRLRADERVGAVNDIFEVVEPLFKKHRINICLAETVTTECRRYHDATLVCELLALESNDTDAEVKVESIITELTALLAPHTATVPQISSQAPLSTIRWVNKGVVRNGWVCGCRWFDEIAGSPHESSDGRTSESIERFDRAGLDTLRAVVFSDQEARVARFVFPREHALSVAIEHADIPGALVELTSALKKSHLNLLTTLLRRGGAMHGNATLISVCEPEEGKNVDAVAGRLAADLQDEIRNGLRGIDPRYQSADPLVGAGRHPSEVLMLRHPEDRIIQVPRRLRDSVRAIRDEHGRDNIPVFVSRRFGSDQYRVRRITSIVHNTLKDAKFHPLEANPSSLDENPTTVEQVESRLWASDLGIVLVIDTGDPEPFSRNLAHEYGFLHGQDKPVLFLVEKQLLSEVGKVLSNIQGLVISTFSGGDSAYDDENPQSVGVRLAEWLGDVRPHLEERKHRL